jgi:pimeloyl-ACP methyl ester carboxylesterase
MRPRLSAESDTRLWSSDQTEELWHFGFFQQPDIPELLVARHEFAFIRRFIHDREYRPIADDDIRVYADAYAAPGGLRAGFERYRAFPQDEKRFAEFEKAKLPMPVLALAGDKSNGMVELNDAGLATAVTGGTAPETGHWLPDENPTFLSAQLVTFLREHGR